MNRWIESSRLSRSSRLLLVVASAVLAWAVEARAQDDGAILLFSDPGYTSCSLVDVADQEYTVYMVHVDENGVTGSGFRIWNNTELTYVGENVPWSSIGDTFWGLSVAYNECVSGEILVGTVTYMGSGTSAPCSFLQIIPNGFGEVEAIDCAAVKIFPLAGRLVVNPDPSCLCEPVVPVEETSWGRVKALYE